MTHARRGWIKVESLDSCEKNYFHTSYLVFIHPFYKTNDYDNTFTLDKRKFFLFFSFYKLAFILDKALKKYYKLKNWEEESGWELELENTEHADQLWFLRHNYDRSSRSCIIADEARGFVCWKLNRRLRICLSMVEMIVSGGLKICRWNLVLRSDQIHRLLLEFLGGWNDLGLCCYRVREDIAMSSSKLKRNQHRHAISHHIVLL